MTIRGTVLARVMSKFCLKFPTVNGMQSLPGGRSIHAVILFAHLDSPLLCCRSHVRATAALCVLRR